jgi:hypothetical protein
VAGGPATAAYACTGGPSQFTVWAWTPQSGNPIWDNGGVNSYPDAACGTDQKTMWETKACGFWGCSWETWAQTNWRQPQGSYYNQWAQSGCRGGTNRYRTESDYLVGNSNTYWATSSEPQYSC